MFEAKFKLKHSGCWTGGLAKFKSAFVTHITVSLTHDFVQDVTEVELLNPDEAPLIKKYFDECKIVVKWNILEESEKRLLIQVFTDTSKINSVVHTIIKNKCFVPRKVPLSDGWEVWTIASPKKEFIKGALSEIRTLGDFRLLYVKKSTFDGFNLSEQQENVLKAAVELGYYRWPRKISATELARRLKLNKATVLEHLRKAEIKVMKKEFAV